MQREIKFRVWNGQEMEYSVMAGIYGVFFVNPENGNGLDTKDTASLTPANTKYFDGTPVMQFTGLHDKNRKEIYEGDIVRWDDMSNGKGWRVSVVELFPALRFRIIKINCEFRQSAREGEIFWFSSFAYQDTHNHLEIIGNIFENSELLNK